MQRLILPVILFVHVFAVLGKLKDSFMFVYVAVVYSSSINPKCQLAAYQISSKSVWLFVREEITKTYIEQI